MLFVLFALPQLLSLYYIGAMTQVAVYAIVALGLGVLVGRVGLVSFGQVAVLAIGAWVAARLLFATSLPYPVVLLGAGVITMVLGTLIGLPALRLRGLYLALITLMLAGGITVALATTNFPNGGSAGINTTLYKLWAFALASFITGVAGGVLAGAIHYLYSIDFPTQDSITLLAVVLMGGAYSLWGAVVAALLYQLLPALLNNWGVSSDWLTILFGIGVLQVLTTAPAGLADQVPKDLGRLGRLLRRRVLPGRLLPGRLLPGRVPRKRLRGPSQSGGGAG